MTTTRVAEPELRFRLVGQWHPIVLPDAPSNDLIHRYVSDIVGKRDDLATMRALITRELRGVLELADGELTAMFVMTSLRPDVPVPATLTVISRSDLRMSPAIGTGATAVIEILAESFRQLSRPGVETMTTLSIPGSEVLRLHTVNQVKPEFSEEDKAAAPPEILAEAKQLHPRSLDVEYWCTVPGTKNVVLVRLSTPMADIPNVMLGLFDSIVRASYFEMPDEPDEA